MKGFHGALNANYDGTQPAGLKEKDLSGTSTWEKWPTHLLSPKSSEQHARPV